MWRTWLIPGKKMDRGTEKRLRQDFSIPDVVDLSLRPVATLGIEDGQPVLRCENQDSLVRFFNALDELLDRSAGSVRALSFAPHEELQVLHGWCLWFKLRSYRVLWEGNGISDVSEPYARRFIQIEEGRLRVAKDPNEKQISNRFGPGQAPLFLSPIELSLDDTRAKACVGAGEHVWFLPPVREEDHPERHQSYFSIDRQRFRTLFRQLTGVEEPDLDEPVAVLLQRLIDDPLLRDLLLEGSGIRVEGTKGEPTSLALEVHEGDDISGTRAGIVLGSLSGVPDWVRPLVEELRRDVQSLTPGPVVRQSPGRQRTDWFIPPGEMARPITEEKGIWHRLAALGERLHEQDQDRARPLQEQVLRISNPGDRFNHHEALQLFSKNFWRRPWCAPPGSRNDDAWFRAIVDILYSKQLDTERTSAHWFGQRERWGEGFNHDMAGGPEGLRVSYAISPSNEDLLYWRLLYPLGAVINSRTLYLDRGERSRLNSRLVLA